MGQSTAKINGPPGSGARQGERGDERVGGHRVDGDYGPVVAAAGPAVVPEVDPGRRAVLPEELVARHEGESARGIRRQDIAVSQIPLVDGEQAADLGLELVDRAAHRL